MTITLSGVNAGDLYDICELAQSALSMADRGPNGLFSTAEHIKNQCLPLCCKGSKPSKDYRVAEKKLMELLKKQ